MSSAHLFRGFTKSNAWIFILLAAIVPAQSFAAKWSNQFVEFEMPPQWSCSLEGAEWVCQSMNEEKKRDAIIVLAAKLKGDQDSIDQYLTYLKGSKTFTSAQGKPVKSDPKFTKTSEINGQPWVDALHMESEIPGFYTRYLATVKQDIGVLVTYSIQKDKYKQYNDEFENMVKTLKVFRKSGGINVNPQEGKIFDVKIPSNVTSEGIFPGAAPQGGAEAPSQKKEEPLPLIPLAAGGAAIAFFIWRKKRNAG